MRTLSALMRIQTLIVESCPAVEARNPMEIEPRMLVDAKGLKHDATFHIKTLQRFSKFSYLSAPLICQCSIKSVSRST